MKHSAHRILIAVACGLGGCAEGYGGYGGGYGPAYYGSNYLGYGGGYYDRTLSALHAVTIGIAYAGQEVDALPREAHDHPLDMVMTENGLRRFTTRRE